ncbi:MAG: DUF5989 family protein [Candidatus Omnitrophica bacterium]|nr:DUF5989 family protein [Candidatus Omnitrophota bacterium]
MSKSKKKFTQRFTVLHDLGRYLWKNKLWWMMPIVIILGGIALLMIFTYNSSVVPFTYALF